MARNFCGFIDFDNETNPKIVFQMANRLNLNDLYTLNEKHISHAHMINLYSENFPAPKSDDFM